MATTVHDYQIMLRKPGGNWFAGGRSSNPALIESLKKMFLGQGYEVEVKDLNETYPPTPIKTQPPGPPIPVPPPPPYTPKPPVYAPPPTPLPPKPPAPPKPPVYAPPPQPIYGSKPPRKPPICGKWLVVIVPCGCSGVPKPPVTCGLNVIMIDRKRVYYRIDDGPMECGAYDPNREAVTVVCRGVIVEACPQLSGNRWVMAGTMASGGTSSTWTARQA